MPVGTEAVCMEAAQMEAMILMRNREAREQLAAHLQQLGMETITIKQTVTDAVYAHQAAPESFVFFERELAADFASFFELFPGDQCTFVAVSRKWDPLDVIDAINCHRIAYYLILPLRQKNVAKAVRCLRGELL